MKKSDWVSGLSAAGLLVLTGCATAPNSAKAPAPAPAVEAGPKLHLVLTAKSPSNVGRHVIDADIESWTRPNSGPILYASPSGADADCTPNVTVSFAETPAADARYAVGQQVQLFIETQCGVDGEMRSWKATTGSLTIAETAEGYRVHISQAEMTPTEGDNAGYGTFVADGMGTGVTLHAS